MPSTETWVYAGLVAGLWFVREVLYLVPRLLKSLKGVDSSNPKLSAKTPPDGSGTDNSGAFAVIIDKFATKKELNQLRTDIRDDLSDIKKHIDTLAKYAKANAEQFTKLNRTIGQLEGIIQAKKGK